jgi:multiple sugar transport system substrate-binding protein
MFKKIALLLGMVFIFMPLTACGGDDSGVSGGDPTNQNSIRVGIMESASERAMMEDLVAKFKVANSEVDIRIESYSGDYSQKLISQASSGALPDVFMTIDTLVGFFAQRNISLALDEYFSAEELSGYYEKIVDMGKVGGKIHAMPRDYSRIVVFYNTALFTRAALPKPQNNWTWDDFTQTAAALKALSGVEAGADLQLNFPAATIPYVIGMGGSIFPSDTGNTESNFNNAGTRAAIVELRTLVGNGSIRNTFSGTGSFSGGNVGMYFAPRSQTTVVHNSLGGTWDVVACPEFPADAVIGSGLAGYSISALTKKKEMAVKFLRFLMGEDGQKALGNTGNVVPVLKSLANDNSWKDYPVTGKNTDAFLAHTERDIKPLGALLADSSKSTKVTDALNMALEALLACADGNIDSELAKAQTNISNAMK